MKNTESKGSDNK